MGGNTERMAKMFRPEVLDMEEYNPPLEGRSGEGFLRLDFNERTTPPHPLVVQYVEDYTTGRGLQIYPEYGTLNNVLAGYAGVKPDQVIASNGSDQAIDVINRLVLDKRKIAIVPSPTFDMLKLSAQVQGARIISPRYRDENLDFPFEEVMDLIDRKTNLAVICNPNNPTGTTLTPDKSEAIIRKANKLGIAVLVDEAYHEFAPELTVAGLVDKYDNLFVTRSLSKIMGIAELRPGYAISQPQNIAQLRKIRGPYDVNMAAAGAMMSLREPEVVEDMRAYAGEVMEMSKPVVEEFYRENGVRFFPSGANFHMIQAGKEFVDFMESRKILVRKKSDPPGIVRVSIGTREDTHKYIEAFREFIESHRQAS